jgi:signal peptidase I
MHKNDQRNTSTEMACGLAGEVVRTFGKVRLRVFGTSMVPSILPGDLIVIQRAGLREISPGEVVLFTWMGRLFVHRVVDRKGSSAAAGLDETFLITRGDRLAHDDPPVSSRDLLGRVVSVERGNRKVELPARTDGSTHYIARLLRASDRATYLYLRLAACRQTIFIRGTKCRV